MENENIETLAGVAVEGTYKKIDELKEDELNKVFHPYTAQFLSRASKNDRSLFFYSVRIPIISSLKINFNLDEALFAVIKAERGIAPQLSNFNATVAVRFVEGVYKTGGSYIFAEIKCCKDVVQRVFLSPSQILLLKVVKGFTLPVVQKVGLDDVDGVGSQADVSSLF